MRVIVCGCRDWSDASRLELELDKLLARWPDMILVHGDCQTGADKLASDWAKARGIPTEPHPPEWQKYGNYAGPKRNIDMAQAGAVLCLAFWDGASRGTYSMIVQAVLNGIPVRIIPLIIRDWSWK